jgi:hypothetical protein
VVVVVLSIAITHAHMSAAEQAVLSVRERRQTRQGVENEFIRFNLPASFCDYARFAILALQAIDVVGRF